VGKNRIYLLQKENQFDTFSCLNILYNNYFNELISRFHSTDTTPKNNIVINSTTNNHITIINNVFNRQKKIIISIKKK
jgi:hypothetical protein